MSEAKLAVDIGSFFRSIRLGKGLSQSCAAKRIGISSSYLNKVEQGKMIPNAQLISKLMASYELADERQKELEILLSKAQLFTEREKTCFQQAAMLAKQIAPPREAPAELRILCQLLLLPRDVRQRIIRATIAYDSSSGETVTK
ncbi:MAG: hypothetical protein A2599_02085 [Candidatus Staskawiczbacteria bacterium RIFOXYD1_FULL_39_28]|uniref:HTH cro/C1-type domain-containing protein n=1 Tax=Candidatus Staskawiczbacteria bacterium RIFOXYC1_FULL_38_18 TaxID=1802229 RepID=A0A1G2JDG2_9BACT|nr:MAG: hypothetical protein A2401_02725 [Candidatus Staskawiczbacteria bacterium RIFOXYC1_FULL_38_18]OGZ91818.1 MAG: hypothetical protein A2599_02085 [Candidatus Staskawiczbacteria bacterium RIFOXYD1_FULL_39_28]